MRYLGLDPEKFLVWYQLDEKFRELYGCLIADIDWKQFNWKKALSYASYNSVSYEFCKKILEEDVVIDKDDLLIIRSVIKNVESKLQKLKNTLHMIKELLNGKVNFYIIKTRGDVPTADVDVLLENKRDYELAFNLALNRGYKCVREEPFKGWIGIKNCIKIELHVGISWFGMRVFDNEFIFKNPRKVKIMHLEFSTLGEEAEFGLALAHWILDIHPLLLSGLGGYVSRIERVHRWDEIMHQAEKYGWAKQLIYHLSILQKLCEYIYFYQLPLPIEPLNVRVKPNFPFWPPLWSKIPFLIRKIIQDNSKATKALEMIQLLLRRYAWTRLCFYKKGIVAKWLS